MFLKKQPCRQNHSCSSDSNYFNRSKQLICIAFILLTHPGFSQDTILRIVDLLQLAEANYPYLKVAQLNADAANASTEAARLTYLPQLRIEEQATHATANGSTGSYLTGMDFSTSGSIVTSKSSVAVDGSISNLVLDWSILTFGKVRAAINIAKANESQAQLNYKTELFFQKVKIIDAYLGALAAMKKQHVSKQFLDRAVLMHTSTTAMVKSGIKSGVDSSIANASLSLARRSLIESEKNVDISIQQLAKLSGVNVQRIKIDTSNYLNLLPRINLSDSVQFKNNPNVLAAEIQATLSLSKLKLTDKSFWPNLHLIALTSERGSGISTGTPQTDNPLFGAGFTPNAFNYLVGLSLNWNILYYPQYNRQVKSARIEWHRDEMNTVATTYDAKIDLQIAKRQIQAQYDQALEAPVGLLAAQMAYNQTNARYQNGLATIIDLTQGLYMLNTAELDLITTRLNVWRAILQETAITGNINNFLNL